MIREGTVIAGKYRMERLLARGGMGSVWVARHLQLDTEVAIKLMEPSFARLAEGRARFEREAKASVLVKSPHVVQVLDYGIEGDTPYIVMELLEGEDLGKRLRRVGRLSLAETARILDPLCKGLRRAHEAGLVHRDLKPANVFLARHGDEDLVKILDFGIVKMLSPDAGSVTKTGSGFGSPQYMSPEQIRWFKHVDHRCDLWAVGIILYEALTGQVPFRDLDVTALMVVICTEPVPPPSSVLPSLGPEVDRFFARALARNPAERFQDARELAAVFSALADGSAPPPSATGERPAVLPASSARTASAPRPPYARLMSLSGVLLVLAAAIVLWRVGRPVPVVPASSSTPSAPEPSAMLPAPPEPPPPATAVPAKTSAPATSAPSASARAAPTASAAAPPRGPSSTQRKVQQQLGI